MNEERYEERVSWQLVFLFLGFWHKKLACFIPPELALLITLAISHEITYDYYCVFIFVTFTSTPRISSDNF
jgi:hypothetical protein